MGYLLLGRGGFLGFRTGEHMIIGASTECDLCIQVEHVSRFHCEIFASEDERCFVRDLHSSNGTLVNGQHISNSWQEVVAGDVVDLQMGVSFVLMSFPLENLEKFVLNS